MLIEAGDAHHPAAWQAGEMHGLLRQLRPVRIRAQETTCSCLVGFHGHGDICNLRGRDARLQQTLDHLRRRKRRRPRLDDLTQRRLVGGARRVVAEAGVVGNPSLADHGRKLTK